MRNCKVCGEYEPGYNIIIEPSSQVPPHPGYSKDNNTELIEACPACTVSIIFDKLTSDKLKSGDFTLTVQAK